MGQIPDSVTICITSCGRLDLLGKTLASFQEHNSGGRYLLSEDSADPAVIAAVKEAYPSFTVLSGDKRLGLMGSIDRLYSAAETPYIFHLEDDWEFEGPFDWAAAIAALDRDDVANVCVKAYDIVKPRYRAQSRGFEAGGAEFRIVDPNAHPEFFGWSSNPGLIKKELYLKHAPSAGSCTIRCRPRSRKRARGSPISFRVLRATSARRETSLIRRCRRGPNRKSASSFAVSRRSSTTRACAKTRSRAAVFARAGWSYERPCRFSAMWRS